MGTRKWHLARADRHREVARHLNETDYSDWAAVALFYAAHQVVHSTLSGESELAKDERHPRKHTGKGGEGHGGRGTNQLVRDLYPSIYPAYRSLFEMSLRTRYDHENINQNLPSDQNAFALLSVQYATVSDFCGSMNRSRPDRSSQEP